MGTTVPSLKLGFVLTACIQELLKSELAMLASTIDSGNSSIYGAMPAAAKQKRIAQPKPERHATAIIFVLRTGQPYIDCDLTNAVLQV